MSFGRGNTRQIVGRIKSRYPFPHRLPVGRVSPPQVEREFGPHGSYVENGHRVHCFADEKVRDAFKEKYP